jgi:hypothetical protein
MKLLEGGATTDGVDEGDGASAAGGGQQHKQPQQQMSTGRPRGTMSKAGKKQTYHLLTLHRRAVHGRLQWHSQVGSVGAPVVDRGGDGVFPHTVWKLPSK